MTLHSYYTNSGKDLILDYINNLPEDEKTDGFSVMECMENGEFDKIRFKRWEKKVYEVYFQKHNRIFYITVDKENIYLLHVCRKQKNSCHTFIARQLSFVLSVHLCSLHLRSNILN